MLRSNRCCIVSGGGKAQMSLRFCYMKKTFGLGIISEVGNVFSLIVSTASLDKVLLTLWLLCLCC